MTCDPLMQKAQEIVPNAVYTLKDACNLLKIGDSTARSWIRTGLLPARRIGKGYRFLGTDLLAALQCPDDSKSSFLETHPGLRFP